MASSRSLSPARPRDPRPRGRGGSRRRDPGPVAVVRRLRHQLPDHRRDVGQSPPDVHDHPPHDADVLFLNVIFLLPVAFVPYPTPGRPAHPGSLRADHRRADLRHGTSYRADVQRPWAYAYRRGRSLKPRRRGLTRQPRLPDRPAGVPGRETLIALINPFISMAIFIECGCQARHLSWMLRLVASRVGRAAESTKRGGQRRLCPEGLRRSPLFVRHPLQATKQRLRRNSRARSGEWSGGRSRAWSPAYPRAWDVTGRRSSSWSSAESSVFSGVNSGDGSSGTSVGATTTVGPSRDVAPSPLSTKSDLRLRAIHSASTGRLAAWRSHASR